jgi:hypothetical protein
VEGALWLYPNSSSDARIAIGRLKLNRQIVFILHIPLKSLQEAVFTVKLLNKILFVRIQNAKNPLQSIGMRQ